MREPTVAEAMDAVLRAAGKDVREYVEPELDALIAAVVRATVERCVEELDELPYVFEGGFYWLTFPDALAAIRAVAAQEAADA